MNDIDILTNEEKEAIHLLAERAVTIPEGDRSGKWTREARVMLVYSVLCSLFRIKKREAEDEPG